MPADYEAILADLRKRNPKMSEKELKSHAARITIAQREKEGRPMPRFHHGGKKSMVNGG